MRKMFIYERGPIDYWTGWHTFDNFIKELYEERNFIGDNELKKIADQLKKRKEELIYSFAKHTIWEGNGEWYISSIPGDQEKDGTYSEFIIAVKQLNNGLTFIATPYPMEWCGELKIVTVEGEA